MSSNPLDALLAKYGTDHTGVTEIEKGGSGRRFFRVHTAQHGPAILCAYDDSRPENHLYADIAGFLGDTLGLPTPRVIEWRPELRVILLEDLGEADLWSLRNADWETRRVAWGDALRTLAKWHAPAALEAQRAAGVRLMDGFGPELYKWERDYFRDNAVAHLLDRPLSEERAAALEKELSALADRLMALPAALVHRDCQSQNILWKDGRAHFIDFQGMRVGTAFYDLGSLLYDPYVRIEPRERAQLLGDYAEAAGTYRTPAFMQAFLDAAAQRLMQALGAYHFLGITKGRTDFLTHVRPALGNLLEVTRENQKLPALRDLVQELAVNHVVKNDKIFG